MKKQDVKVGGVYKCKVGGHDTEVRIVRENDELGGWDGENLSTGKAVRIKSPQRLKAEVMPPQNAQDQRGDDAQQAEEKGQKKGVDTRPIGQREALALDNLPPLEEDNPVNVKPGSRPAIIYQIIKRGNQTMDSVAQQLHEFLPSRFKTPRSARTYIKDVFGTWEMRGHVKVIEDKQGRIKLKK